MRKEDGQVVKSYRGPAFFAFHHINAFERGNDVVVDIVTYPDASIIADLYLDKVTADRENAPWGAFTRYTLPLAGDSLTEESITEEGIELPRINYERNNGREYRFVYSCGGDRANPNDFLNRLVKIDVQDRTAQIWHEDDCYPGEPIFVAAPDANAEDEGVVLSVVLNGKQGNSFLLVLDAATFHELARAEVPHHIPFGFHGMYSRH
jgi:carotenoid cleavage dioxygenase-like enzyme